MAVVRPEGNRGATDDRGCRYKLLHTGSRLQDLGELWIAPIQPTSLGVRQVRRAVAQLGSTVEKVLQESGMTEEELAHLFDLRRPMPE